MSSGEPNDSLATGKYYSSILLLYMPNFIVTRSHMNIEANNNKPLIFYIPQKTIIGCWNHQ